MRKLFIGLIAVAGLVALAQSASAFTLDPCREKCDFLKDPKDRASCLQECAGGGGGGGQTTCVMFNGVCYSSLDTALAACKAKLAEMGAEGVTCWVKNFTVDFGNWTPKFGPADNQDTCGGPTESGTSCIPPADYNPETYGPPCPAECDNCPTPADCPFSTPDSE